MPSSAYRDRTFRAAEVRRILRRAAELDEVEQAPGDAGRGHTLEEIERIAGDAGITAEALRRAIAGEVAPPLVTERPFSLAPDPATLSIERTALGSVDATRHEEIATAMRAAVGVLGDARAAGDALHWSSTTGGRKVRAIVEPTGDGRVTVRVDEDLRSLRGGIFSGAMAGSFLLSLPLVALFAPEGVPYVLIGWVVFAYLAGWVVYGRRFAAREAQLRALVSGTLAVAGARGARVAEHGAPENARVASVDEAESEEASDEGSDPARRHVRR